MQPQPGPRKREPDQLPPVMARNAATSLPPLSSSGLLAVWSDRSRRRRAVQRVLGRPEPQAEDFPRPGAVHSPVERVRGADPRSPMRRPSATHPGAPRDRSAALAAQASPGGVHPGAPWPRPECRRLALDGCPFLVHRVGRQADPRTLKPSSPRALESEAVDSHGVDCRRCDRCGIHTVT